MIRGLRARLALVFIGVASGVLLISGFMHIYETHYHFSMYKRDLIGKTNNIHDIYAHLEKALLQSIIWTSISAILLAVCVSLYVAQRITKPLLSMKKIAEQMAHGKWESRVIVQGNDELSDLGNSLNDLSKELQKQETHRKTLTADVAHELRTPLTTLKSHMEAFKDGVWEPTPTRIHACYEEIERLIHLVGEMEQLTFVESPRFSLRLHKEDLAEVVYQCVVAMHAPFGQKNVQLEYHWPSPIWVHIDRERVIQIVVNLLSNALKFTPQGGVVDVRLEVKPSEVQLVVADSGIGIASEEIPYLFERFYRVEKSRDRKVGGIGIGLTIAKRLVEAHGGTISLHSEIGKGTDVYVSIPKKNCSS